MATRNDIDPRRELAQLEERIREGDTSVTAAELAKARQAAELASLRDEAARRKAERDEAERRQAEEEAFRKELDQARNRLDAMAKTYGELVATLRRFNKQVDDWQRQRLDLMARGKGLGLRDEAEAVLPGLDRDWIALIADEARGDYPRLSSKFIPGTSTHPVLHHELRTRTDRERIDAAEEEKAQARRARIQARQEEKRRERDADRRRVLAFSRNQDPTGDEAA